MYQMEQLRPVFEMIHAALMGPDGPFRAPEPVADPDATAGGA